MQCNGWQSGNWDCCGGGDDDDDGYGYGDGDGADDVAPSHPSFLPSTTSLQMAMAMDLDMKTTMMTTALVAHHPCTNLCFPSSQICRCHITRRHPLYLHLGKFKLLSKGQLMQSLDKQGKIHRGRVKSSVRTISAEFEEISDKTNVYNVQSVIEDLVENYSTLNNEKALLSQPELYPRVEEKFPLELESSSGLIVAEDQSLSVSISLDNEGSIPPHDLSPLDKSSDVEIVGLDDAAIDRSQAAASTMTDSMPNSTTDLVPSTTTDSLSNSKLKSVKEAYESMLAGSQDSKEPESQIDAVSQASHSFGDGLSEINSTVAKALTKVKESIESSLNDAISSLKSIYADINGSVEKSTKSFSFQGGNNATSPRISQKIQTTPENITDILKSPFQMGTPANNTLKVVVTTVEDITSKILAETGQLVAKGYVSTKENLPVDVQLSLDTLEKKVIEVSVPVQSVLKQIYGITLDTEKSLGIDPENPIIPVIFVVGGSITLSIFYWQSRYGGYSGDLTPTAALELLKTERRILLVDIRPESVRENQGIPDLRRQARFKTASVEAFRVESSIQKMLKSTPDAEAAITAALIKNLKNVERNTKVIIMDEDGSQSKNIARALKRAGIKMPYRIGGGFKAWGADGLGVKQMRPETPLTILKEETQAILDDVKPSPTALTAATLGFFAGIYALIEWEKTLQLLGLICIGQVVYTRLNSYDTIEDAKNDLKLVMRPFAVAKEGIVWVAGQVEPNTLQLATSPSTSDVQDRVVQAAAKHGPLPSEPPDQLESQDEIELPSSADNPTLIAEHGSDSAQAS